MRSIVEVVGVRGTGQDRARVIDDRLIVLADGAGGTSLGAESAEMIVARVATGTSLEQLDREVPGQSTAIVLAIDGGEIRGASVGDSEAWLVDGDRVIELTAGQAHKPLVGGGCVPHAIGPVAFAGTLVVGSDGLFRYVPRADIIRLAGGSDLREAALAMIARARMANGALQDDISIVLARP